MQYLRNLARGESVQRVSDYLVETPGAVGVSLRYDDFWFALWSVYNALGTQEFNRLDASGGSPLLEEGTWWEILAPGYVDASWSCRTWERWKEWTGLYRDAPVIVEIQMLAGSFRRNALAEIGDFMGALPGRVVIDTRSATRAQLGSAKGAQLGGPIIPGAVWQSAHSPGSIGGLLTAPSGELCLTTSAHVADSLGAPVYGKPRLAGTCVYTAVWPNADQCRDETAVLTLEEGASAETPVEEVTSAMAADDVPMRVPIRLRGAFSKPRAVEIYQYISNRKVKCLTGDLLIKDGFELRCPANGKFRSRWVPPSKGGDSGAWILSDQPLGTSWCGSLVGGDEVSSVATFASNTLQALNNGVNGEFSLPAVKR